ncbi:MAG: sugar ABC transporter permease [Bacilli bacterium]|nr:sugar ABC transporter permease [Bacilli bacterium]
MATNINFSEKQKVEAYYEKNHWKITFKRMIKDWRLYVMLLPLVFVFICWRYLPMYGLIVSFKDFDAGQGVLGSNFVGLAGFQYLIEDELFWKAFRNTFMISFYGLLFGFPMPIILALLFSEVKNQAYRSVLQILSYLPKFVSLVVVTSLVTLLCSSANSTQSGGIITQLLTNLKMIPEGAELLRDPKYFRAIYQVSGIWETAGYGSIVYFAAILAISPTNYEAAKMDGANKWAQIRYVTFPGIASTLTIMLILEIGKLFTVGYEKVYLLYDKKNWETSDIIATYVMRASGMAADGTQSLLAQSIAASADLFNAVIAMLLVVGSNMIARKVSSTSLY